MNILLKWLSVVAAVLLIALAAYERTNKSGHTGADPLWAAYLLIPTMLLSTWSLIQRSSYIAWIAFSIAATGIAYIIYLDRTNTLVEYHRWIKRGMPDKGKTSGKAIEPTRPSVTPLVYEPSLVLSSSTLRRGAYRSVVAEVLQVGEAR